MPRYRDFPLRSAVLVVIRMPINDLPQRDFSKPASHFWPCFSLRNHRAPFARRKILSPITQPITRPVKPPLGDRMRGISYVSRLAAAHPSASTTHYQAFVSVKSEAVPFTKSIECQLCQKSFACPNLVHISPLYRRSRPCSVVLDG